jgi:hypothetical protein
MNPMPPAMLSVILDSRITGRQLAYSFPNVHRGRTLGAQPR